MYFFPTKMCWYFSICYKSICYRCPLEVPHWGASSVESHNISFCDKIRKKNYLNTVIMSRTPMGRGTYWFWCWSHWHWRLHLCWHHFLVCAISGESVVRFRPDFCDLDLIFKVTAIEKLKIHGGGISVWKHLLVVLKFCAPIFLTKWHMQTVQTQIRLLLRSSLIRVYTVCPSNQEFCDTNA